MLFIIHILVFTIYFCEKSSTAKRANISISDYFKENAQVFESQLNNKDGGRNIKRDPIIHHPMFQTVKNLTGNHRYNLKSNVFDKMLSEEMFSLKQHFFEKDSSYTTSVKKLSQNKAPIFETKPKWPAVDLFKRPPNTEELDEDAKLTESRQTLKSKYNKPEIKILDVRSLTGHQNSMHPAEIKCNCAHNGNHQCKHGEDCTRKPAQGAVIPSPVPYAPLYMQPPQYEAYLVGGVAVPKPTRRRKPTPQDCDLYYDDDCIKGKRPKNEEIIMNIEYDVEDKPEKFDCIHEDLKEVFRKSTKKKCYCSSSQPLKIHKSLVFISVICLGILDWIYFY